MHKACPFHAFSAFVWSSTPLLLLHSPLFGHLINHLSSLCWNIFIHFVCCYQSLAPYLTCIQWVPQLFERLEIFCVNKSWKIECCGNKTHQIIQNMILSQCLELKLSILWKTTISGGHPLFYRWENVCETLPPLYFNGKRGSDTFSHL